ncbi:hypothetical protein CC86DRAFT_379755 [Ophiobolus disseminans]|uniref:Uncharacterized protein n=1 Tax=Ophiobolus disseminans TaxID=1469910 RepID=A0A6A7A8C3_9PLEO|nr:hypothetical protein CC86DRAFT_379755 [Ophiobolus disseminans]
MVCPREQGKRSDKHDNLARSARGDDFSVPLQAMSRSKSMERIQLPAASVSTLVDQGVSTAFSRLTWKDTMLVDGQDHVDRFLPASLILAKRWRIQTFLRNDPHADVYSVLDIHDSDSRLSMDLAGVHEANVFLEEYHGKSEMYAKRRKRAMRESDNGETIQDEFGLYRDEVGVYPTSRQRPKAMLASDSGYDSARHVIIAEVRPRMRPFKLRLTDEEYPKLPAPAHPLSAPAAGPSKVNTQQIKGRYKIDLVARNRTDYNSKPRWFERHLEELNPNSAMFGQDELEPFDTSIENFPDGAGDVGSFRHSENSEILVDDTIAGMWDTGSPGFSEDHSDYSYDEWYDEEAMYYELTRTVQEIQWGHKMGVY